MALALMAFHSSLWLDMTFALAPCRPFVLRLRIIGKRGICA
jgi:hypothetical protein